MCRFRMSGTSAILHEELERQEKSRPATTDLVFPPAVWVISSSSISCSLLLFASSTMLESPCF
jgi:hypothetical protein